MQALNHDHGFSAIPMLLWAQLSPDGKWIALGFDLTGVTKRPAFQQNLAVTGAAVVSLDGTHWMDVTEADGSLWTQDSRKCIFPSSDGRATMVDLVTHKTQRLDLCKYFRHAPLPPARQAPLSWEVTPDGRVFETTYPFVAGSPSIKGMDLGLEPGGQPPQTISLFLPKEIWPPGTSLHGEAVSPDGRRLAWLFKMDNGYEMQLWVSDAAGNHMKRLGTYQPHHFSSSLHDMMNDYNLLSATYMFPSALQWTPDGQHLSFLCKGNLYTIPAD